jgi:phage shock protein E
MIDLRIALITIGFFAAPACSRQDATPGQTPAKAESPAGDEQPGTEAGSGLPDRDSALAHKLVKQGGVLLDVRTPEEYEEGHVEGAVNISHDRLEAQLAEVEKLTAGDKNKPIVVYCRSGGRAGKAKQVLLDHGYTQVTNLGGLKDW